MARNVAWGIDIGESAIKAVKCRKVGDSIVIQDYRTVPCEAGPEDAGGGDREARIRSALATLQRDIRLKGTTVAVSMPGRDVFPRFISLPPVEKKRIPELVRYEARTQMPFPIEEVIWDYQPLAEEVEPGEEVEVALFAIKRASVYHFLDSLSATGLQADLVEISPLALYNYMMYDRPVEAATVLIDLGAGNTDLVILDAERFWTRNVSISGNDITRALQEKYQISFEEAESLKRKAASSEQADKLFGVMRPILDDLIGEIQR
ncbi:MAG: type IV pilus assembly protein PilM, partial [Planctomycetota bacterium]